MENKLDERMGFIVNLQLSKQCNMELSVIQFGDYKGIQLPGVLLKMYKIVDTVELTLEEDHIILTAKMPPRNGWEESFKELHENSDDKMLITDIFDDEELEEWK